MMTYDDGGANASKARNKLAAHLRSRGIDVRGNPANDQDFFQAIRDWADRKIAQEVTRVRWEEQKKAQAKINAMRPPIDPRPLTWKERISGRVSKS
jgi:uncharacterized protein YifN (PemK superfamily)